MLAGQILLTSGYSKYNIVIVNILPLLVDIKLSDDCWIVPRLDQM